MGFTLEDYRTIIWRFLAWGDCFASIFENEQGRLIPRILPTWQVHLEADEWTGEIKRAYQRRPGVRQEQNIDLDTFCHWCYHKNHLYGRSLFFEVRDSAKFYKQNSEDLAIASREAALIPMIHEMPDGADSEYLDAYKRDHKQQLKFGPVSDIYVLKGGTVGRAGRGTAELSSMIEPLKLRRIEIAVASHIPPQLLGVDSPTQASQDLSMQPSMMLTIFIGEIRHYLASKLYDQVNALLERRGLKLGYPPYPYSITFPEIQINPWRDPQHKPSGSDHQPSPATTPPKKKPDTGEYDYEPKKPDPYAVPDSPDSPDGTVP